MAGEAVEDVSEAHGPPTLMGMLGTCACLVKKAHSSCQSLVPLRKLFNKGD